MASGKLSPRQKMINMMYLVLMALLALNVSREILKSFHLMEVSFSKARENLDGKIDAQMKSFAKQAGNDPTLIPYYDRAKRAQEISDKFVNYIERVKHELDSISGGREEIDEEDMHEDSKYYDSEMIATDNIELHANYFMVDDAKGTKDEGWRGVELELMINNTRRDLIAVLISDKKNGVEIPKDKMEAAEKACQLSAVLESNEKKYKTWSEKYIEHSPLGGVMTMLAKMQNDARATHDEVLGILNQGDVPVVNISGLVPMIRPINGSVVMRGGTYEAEIFLAAQTKGSANDEYFVNGTKLEPVDGKMIYKAAGGTSGNYDFKGVVKVKTPKGTESYEFGGAYQVFEGGATISATKMNVLYIGVKNDISVGVPGVNPREVTVSMTGGRIVRSGKNYVATCTRRGTAVISASAKMPDGSSRRVGSAEYRVKKLPKPIGMWGGISSGTPSPKPALLAQRSVVASMGQGFILDGIKYTVQSYQFVHAPKRGEAFVTKGKGGHISGSMRGAIKRAKRGDRIIVDQIRATGPGGRVTLNPIMIEII